MSTKIIGLFIVTSQTRCIPNTLHQRRLFSSSQQPRSDANYPVSTSSGISFLFIRQHTIHQSAGGGLCQLSSPYTTLTYTYKDSLVVLSYFNPSLRTYINRIATHHGLSLMKLTFTAIQTIAIHFIQGGVKPKYPWQDYERRDRRH